MGLNNGVIMDRYKILNLVGCLLAVAALGIPYGYLVLWLVPTAKIGLIIATYCLVATVSSLILSFYERRNFEILEILT